MKNVLGRTLAAAVLILSAILVAAHGQGPRKTVPLVVTGDTLVILKSLPAKVTAPPGSTLYDWSFPDDVKADSDGNVLTITQAPKGKFVVRVRATVIDFDKKQVTRDVGEIQVNYGGVDPVPPPPDPTPPPPPVPPPSPAPIPVAGFRVLIVEDVNKRKDMPPAQLAILFDKSVRDCLDSKCIVGPDSKTKEWRIWPVGVDATAESKLWQDAMKRERKSHPWLIVSDGKTGWEGPLPASVEETLNLLKKLGG